MAQPTPQPWQVAASKTAPARAASRSGGARPAEDLLRPAADAAAAPKAPPAPPPAVVPTDAKGFQQYLNDHGANPKLKVDGIVGPKTLAAAQQLNVAVPENLVAPAPVAAPVQQREAPPAPPAAPDAPQDTGATATPAPVAATPEQIQQQMRAKYGYLGALLDRPDVLDALTRAVTEDLPDNEALALLFATPTWQTTQASVRNYVGMQSSDPASLQATIAQKTAAVAQQAKTAGITIAPERLTQIATDSVRLGWDQNQINAAVGAEFHYAPGGQTGGIGTAEANLRSIADQYGVGKYLDDNTLASYETQIAQGTATADTFKQNFVKLAQQTFPGLANQISIDNPTENVLAPWRNLASNELGLAPTTIDFSDPKWNRLVNQIDPANGKPAPMSLFDAQKLIRTDSTYGWGYTKNGQDAAYQFAHSFLSAVGKAPGA